MAYKKVSKLFCFKSQDEAIAFTYFANTLGIKGTQFKFKAPDCVLVEDIPEPVLDKLKAGGRYPVW